MNTPTITGYENYNLIWHGTADCNKSVEGDERCQVALIESPKHKKQKIVVCWRGKWIVSSNFEFFREFECPETGGLIERVNPEISELIVKALQNRQK